MDTDKMERTVDALNAKAVTATDSADALRFTQAATNAANSYCALMTVIKASND